MILDNNQINFIKKLVVIGLVSDDNLMETLVLKGGNAMTLAYGISTRSSLDLDFSMESDFKEEFETIKARIKGTLTRTFLEHNYHLFDFGFRPKPQSVKEEVKDFWGGYEIGFKVISTQNYEKFSGNEDKIRRNAIPINKNNSPTISIDISKFEYVEDKEIMEVDGYRYYVYSLNMIVLEKLRAICQQLPQYSDVIKSKTQRGRSKDFYDIHTILTHFQIDIGTDNFKELLKLVFMAKNVPLDYIKEIKNSKEIHQESFITLKDTISSTEREQLQDFSFYFDFVVKTFENI